MKNLFNNGALNLFGIDTYLCAHAQDTDAYSTLAVSEDYSECNAFISEVEDKLLKFGCDCDIVVFDLNLKRVLNNFISGDSTICDSEEEIEDALDRLLLYARNCKKVVQKNKCASMLDYLNKNKNFKHKRILLVIPNLAELLDLDGATGIKERLIQLIRLEKYSLITTVACMLNNVNYELDIRFVNAFVNRILFRVSDDRIASLASFGMYRSTEKLEEGEFYYFGASGINGSLMCIG